MDFPRFALQNKKAAYRFDIFNKAQPFPGAEKVVLSLTTTVSRQNPRFKPFF